MRRTSPRASACSCSATSSPATAVVLPVPGPAGDHGRPLAGGVRAGRAAARRDGRVRPGTTRASEAASSAASVGGAGGGASRRSSSDLGLLLVVAVEVEQAVLPVHARRPRPAGSAATAADHSAGSGHGRSRSAEWLGDRRPARDTPSRARTARDGERDRRAGRRSSLSPPSRPSVVATWTSARGQHAGGVEGGQRPVAPRARSRSWCVDGFEELAHAVTTPSSRSDSSSTSATGGRHEKTPHGRPSTRGVSGPHMPRR